MVVVAVACGGTDGEAVRDGGSPGSSDGSGPVSGDAGGSSPYPKPCHPLYAPELFPTFEVDIDDAEWAAIQDEYTNWMDRQEMGLPLKPYHPITFSYRGETRSAHMRLKGSPCCTWRGADKMQFVIS